MAGRTRTADVVLLAERDGVPLLLAVRRAKPPFRAALALPGGFLEPGEHPLDAAVRELAEETGIRLPRTALRELGDYAAPGRDPRGPVTSTAFHARLPTPPPPTAGSDAAGAAWVPLAEFLAGPTAFDHHDIVRDALRPTNGAPP